MFWEHTSSFYIVFINVLAHHNNSLRQVLLVASLQMRKLSDRNVECLVNVTVLIEDTVKIQTCLLAPEFMLLTMLFYCFRKAQQYL